MHDFQDDLWREAATNENCKIEKSRKMGKLKNTINNAAVRECVVMEECGIKGSRRAGEQESRRAGEQESRRAGEQESKVVRHPWKGELRLGLEGRGKKN